MLCTMFHIWESYQTTPTESCNENESTWKHEQCDVIPEAQLTNSQTVGISSVPSAIMIFGVIASDGKKRCHSNFSSLVKGFRRRFLIKSSGIRLCVGCCKISTLVIIFEPKIILLIIRRKKCWRSAKTTPMKFDLSNSGFLPAQTWNSGTIPYRKILKHSNNITSLVNVVYLQ